MRKLFTFSLVIFIVAFCHNGNAQYVTLVNFNGTNGAAPKSSTLTLLNNILYGTTNQGGANNLGCIFSVDTNGNGYKDLFDFSDTTGTNPCVSLLIVGKEMYGTTNLGGAYGWGCVYRIDTGGNGYKDLLDFDITNGEWAQGSVVLVGSRLYGLCQQGGLNGTGTLYSIDTAGNNYKDVLDFGASTGWPAFGALTLAAGSTLYGTNEIGGPNSSGGNIFSVDTSGNNYKQIFGFFSQTGVNPCGTLVLSGKTLFGMASGRGANDSGTVFSLDTNGNNFKVLFNLGGIYGGFPTTSLTLWGGVLYGMPYDGGAYNLGCIFALDTDGSNYTKILDFNDTNGASPQFGAVTLGGGIFGMAAGGGASDSGTAFKLNINNLPTSIPQIAKISASASLFPNPSNGKFIVSCHSNQSEESPPIIEIYNLLGEKVYSQSNSQNSTFNIDLSSQPNGVYLYRVLKENGELIGSGKLTIEK